MAAAVLGDEVVCSVERAVHVLGARWTPLILRELYYGCTRFDEIRQRLGIATNLLTTRLGDLVESGVIERLPYKDGHARTRHEYHLTAAVERRSLSLAPCNSGAIGTSLAPRDRRCCGDIATEAVSCTWRLSMTTVAKSRCKMLRWSRRRDCRNSRHWRLS